MKWPANCMQGHETALCMDKDTCPDRLTCELWASKYKNMSDEDYKAVHTSLEKYFQILREEMPDNNP